MIDTIEQYLAARNSMTPAAVSGKKGQEIIIPCVNTLLVARSLVVANTYNPNSVSDDKMELLRESIVHNGFAFPIIVIYDPELEQFVIVDGFHRWLISGPEWLDMPYVPIAVLDLTTAQRLEATWMFNKARGVHQVDLDADLIRALIEQGVPEDEIAQRLGIDLDTVFRYKQVTGIAALFGSTPYSMSWSMAEVDDGMEIR